jgi:hypothetical protein
MAELKTHVCDECGALKGGANHWFVAYTVATGAGRAFCVAPWDARRTGVMLDIRCFDVVLHLCSESCTSKAMSKYLGAS